MSKHEGPSESRARRSKLAGRLLLSLIALATGVGLAEGLLRLIAPTSQHFEVWTSGSRHERVAPDGRLPGVSGPAVYLVNSEGIRGDELSPDDRWRLLAVGGSTTECSFLDQTESWPALVQDELRAARPDLSAWVGNVGRSGHDTRHHVLQLRHLLPQLEGRIDTVVALVGVNDLARRLARDGAWTPTRWDDPGALSELYRASFHVRGSAYDGHLPAWKRTELWRRLRGIAHRTVLASTILDPSAANLVKWRENRAEGPRREGGLPDLGDGLAEYTRNVDRMIDLAEEHGVQIVFLTQPTLYRADLLPEEEAALWMGGVGPFQTETGHEYYPPLALSLAMKRYNEALLAACRDRGVPCFDLAEALPRSLEVLYDDCHFNEEGSRRVAGMVSAFLLEHAPDGEPAGR